MDMDPKNPMTFLVNGVRVTMTRVEWSPTPHALLVLIDREGERVLELLDQIQTVFDCGIRETKTGPYEFRFIGGLEFDVVDTMRAGGIGVKQIDVNKKS